MGSRRVSVGAQGGGGRASGCKCGATYLLEVRGVCAGSAFAGRQPRAALSEVKLKEALTAEDEVEDEVVLEVEAQDRRPVGVADVLDALEPEQAVDVLDGDLGVAVLAVEALGLEVTQHEREVVERELDRPLLAVGVDDLDLVVREDRVLVDREGCAGCPDVSTSETEAVQGA